VKSAVNFGSILSDYFTSKGYDVKKLQGSICFDPFFRMLQIGKEMSKEDTLITRNQQFYFFLKCGGTYLPAAG